MLESEEIVRRSKVNMALVLVMIVVTALSFVVTGYFYIQNTMLENDKVYLQGEISNLENEKTSLQSQVSNLQSEIFTDYESGYDAGYDDGYIQGVKDGAGRGYNIRDPTYDEAIAFMNLDQTDENEYSESYTCFNFAADFENNAFQAGYRCGFVYVEFVEGAHATVCFDTIDKGLIFIEVQEDDIVILTIGQPYWDRAKYEPPDYNDTVVSFTIIW